MGGKSFLAQLFRDAGADYFLKDDPRSGGVTLDFETVYSQAESADFWRIVNSFDGTFSYDVLKSEDPRYADFRAFREKGVIYCNMREKPFYESMPTQPEVVLEDLIKAFHPDLLPRLSITNDSINLSDETTDNTSYAAYSRIYFCLFSAESASGLGFHSHRFGMEHTLGRNG